MIPRVMQRIRNNVKHFILLLVFALGINFLLQQVFLYSPAQTDLYHGETVDIEKLLHGGDLQLGNAEFQIVIKNNSRIQSQELFQEVDVDFEQDLMIQKEKQYMDEYKERQREKNNALSSSTVIPKVTGDAHHFNRYSVRLRRHNMHRLNRRRQPHIKDATPNVPDVVDSNRKRVDIIQKHMTYGSKDVVGAGVPILDHTTWKQNLNDSLHLNNMHAKQIIGNIKRDIPVRPKHHQILAPNISADQFKVKMGWLHHHEFDHNKKSGNKQKSP